LGGIGTASCCTEIWDFEAFIIAKEFEEEGVWVVTATAVHTWCLEGEIERLV